MQEWVQEREEKLREFFDLRSEVDLLQPSVAPLELSPRMAAHLEHYNLEWHIIPASAGDTSASRKPHQRRRPPLRE